MDRLVIATHNKGKLGEFQDMLGPYVKDIVSAGQLQLPEPEETGTTFEENALAKARTAAEAAGFAALADDGGLCVNALGDMPGLYSARWAGPERDFARAVQRIRDELGANKDTSAYFVCKLALVAPDGKTTVVEGRCDGRLIWEPHGAGGHGYDPWFVPDGFERTFGEMSAEEKHALSHRGKALRALIEACFKK